MVLDGDRKSGNFFHFSVRRQEELILPAYDLFLHLCNPILQATPKVLKWRSDNNYQKQFVTLINLLKPPQWLHLINQMNEHDCKEVVVQSISTTRGDFNHK